MSLDTVSDKSASVLLVVPSVGACPEDGGYYLDRKFVDGMARYTAAWGGPVRAAMVAAPRANLPFGRSYRFGEIPFEISLIPARGDYPPGIWEGAVVAMLSADDHTQLDLASAAAADRPATAYVIENTLDTRIRIAMTSDLPVHKKLRSAVWNIMQEGRRRRALTAADGLQINGAAAATAYQRLNAHSLVYFDTRTEERMYASDAAMEARRRRLMSGAPLRLAFSGRLESLKGVDHLPRIAARLKGRGVKFSLDIFGAGSLNSMLTREIANRGLQDCVSLSGNVDFETVLSAHMRDDVDLFVCCHRQADPSCTYLETLSCGVPIAGYGNAAFTGVLERADCGWSVPIDKAGALGDLIAELNNRRGEIADKAEAGLEFARQHSFEKTFDRRIDHLKSLARKKV